MRRILLVLTVAVMMAVVLVSSAVPALAQQSSPPPPENPPPDELRLNKPGCPVLYSNTPLPTTNTNDPFTLFQNELGGTRCFIDTGLPA